MRVVTTRAALALARKEISEPVALVPTMGALHDGHLSLVRAAQRDGYRVGVSIFVNPRQFGPHEDLDAYPRDVDRDLLLLEAAHVDLVWTPRVEDVYPSGFSSIIHVENVTEVLEGARRPGHFDGVTTVCTILFSAFRADVAYFGQKDAQQVVVLRRLVQDLALPVRLQVEPIRRETDGLAMSSRNRYLDPRQRADAVCLSRGIHAAEAAWQAGHTDAATMRELVEAELCQAGTGTVDYISVADPETLQELSTRIPERGALVSVAVAFGSTRLIDNAVLQPR